MIVIDFTEALSALHYYVNTKHGQIQACRRT